MERFLGEMNCRFDQREWDEWHEQELAGTFGITEQLYNGKKASCLPCFENSFLP